MNVLVDLLRQGVGWRPRVGNHLGFVSVLDQLRLQVPVPGNPDGEQAYARAEIPLRQRRRWEQIAGTFSQMPDVRVHSWTSVVRLPDNETVAFVPNDDRPMPEAIFFTGLGERRGRLRLSIPNGPGGPVTGVVFEASLHCDDMTCIDDYSCNGQCCDGCSCHESLEGLETRLVCWCPKHTCA